jgi:hypothetical protein
VAVAVAHAGSADGQAPGVDVINLFFFVTDREKLSYLHDPRKFFRIFVSMAEAYPSGAPYHASVYGWAPGLAHKFEQAFKILPEKKTLAYFDKASVTKNKV